MTNKIEEAIKEGKLRLARKLESHQCSTVTVANALLILEQTCMELYQAGKADKGEEVKKIVEGMKDSLSITRVPGNIWNDGYADGWNAALDNVKELI